MNKHIDALRSVLCGPDLLIVAEALDGLAVAWMTHHDAPMLFPTRAEAVAYCSDDEQPIPLYAAPVAAAPTLDAELAQDRMSELCELERDVIDSLPAVYYMDPPDGGSVPLGEQVKRMAEDAALWRKHSNTPAAPGIDVLNTAYFQGWVAAAGWADRDDLVADEGSKAYTDERDQRLHGLIDASPKGGSEHFQVRLAEIEGRPRPEPEVDEVEEVVACLGDDAAAMLDENPEDERALNMQRAAELLTELQATSAEVGSDARDAARYRWLRNPSVDVALVIDKVTGEVPYHEGTRTGGYKTYEYRSGDELDAAIDAAMQATSAEVGSDARDAARYRWLRNEYDPSVHDDKHYSLQSLGGADLDAAIDSVLQPTSHGAGVSE